MNSKINQKQIDALKKILYTGLPYGINRATLKALRNRGLINSFDQITSEGIDIICPNAPKAEASPTIIETREVQDKLIQIIMDKGFSMYQRISRDLPEEITGARMSSVVFPEYLSDLRNLANLWSQKWA